MILSTVPVDPQSLVDTVHCAGGCGPIYVVTAVADGVASILFPESGETATLPVAAVLEDPIHI